MSRNDGSGGDSSMPRVMIDSVTADPSSSRICHSVCTQISPSACTSGWPVIVPSRRTCTRPVRCRTRSSDSSSRRRRPGSRSRRSGRRPRRRRSSGTRSRRRPPACREPAVVVREVDRVPVAPALAHRARLLRVQRGDAVGCRDQSVGQPVCELVVDGLGLVARVAGRDVRRPRRRALQVHLHHAGLPVDRRREVRVVDVAAVGEPVRGVGPVEEVSLDGVAPEPQPDRVRDLEVAGGLGEPDRGGEQVIVERVQEGVELDAEPVAVPLPVLRDGLVPRAVEVRRAVLGRVRRIELAAGIGPVDAGRRPSPRPSAPRRRRR